jgi:succinate dehydrogenase / fumarate reductase flavoprotein subunit
MSESPIPVAPTCHYVMGGIPTDAEGHVFTDEQGNVAQGLYAVGECACISVHGANRLGCNSLIDLVVFGKRTGLSVTRYVEENVLQQLPPDSESNVENMIREILGSRGNYRVSLIRAAMQHVMAEKCSVFRDRNGLTKALATIIELKQKLSKASLTSKSRRFNYELQELLELGNMLKTAEAMVFSALTREESRGSHFRNDHPERNDEEWLKHTLIHSSNERLTLSYKPVVITKFPPEKRRY